MMTLDHQLVASATARLRSIDRDTEHDARNLISRYVGLSAFVNEDAEARIRFPRAEQQMRAFVETGRLG